MPASVNSAKKPATKLSVIATTKEKAKEAAPSEPSKKPRRAAAKTPAPNRKAKSNGAMVSDQQRRNYVEVAAYYIAERRGFKCGSELEDWAQAEREVDRLIRENRLNF